MKQKNMKSILIKTAIIAGTFLFGSAIGIVAMRQYALHYGVYGNGINDVNQLITDRVAIVNLDEGVMVQDEKVNYAEKLIIDLDENFSFTGLEDARQGYATGQCHIDALYLETVRLPAHGRRKTGAREMENHRHKGMGKRNRRDGGIHSCYRI